VADRILDPERRKILTFRQAEGLEAIPNPLKFLELDRELRHALWDSIFGFLLSHRRDHGFASMLEGPGRAFVAQIHRHVWRKPLDEALSHSIDFKSSVEEMKQLVLNGKPIDVLEALQVTLRAASLPADLKDSLVKVITSSRTSYTVVDNTISPLASPEERDAVASNLIEVATSSLFGAYAHLKKAGDELAGGSYRDAIREAIHAVESAAINVTGKQNATLGDALAQIQKTNPMHSTMKAAFEKLYAYTNAEKGIRHSLLDSENEKVGREEALFMFSACTAFVAYLIRKNLNCAP
jgi:hypothetical protein